MSRFFVSKPSDLQKNPVVPQKSKNNILLASEAVYANLNWYHNNVLEKYKILSHI
jgi:hypothetical protein